jgi:hypothetical protein
MKNEINPLITFFSKKQTKDGTEYFTGSLNPGVLKKSKGQEIEVILLPSKSIPESLMGLFEKAGNGNMDLLMFGVLGGEDNRLKSKQS